MQIRKRVISFQVSDPVYDLLCRLQEELGEPDKARVIVSGLVAIDTILGLNKKGFQIYAENPDEPETKYEVSV